MQRMTSAQWLAVSVSVLIIASFLQVWFNA